MDDNKDGKITKDEVMQQFDKIDADKDGSLTKEEIRRAIHPPQHRPTAPPARKDDAAKPADSKEPEPTAKPATGPEARRADGPPFGGRPDGPRPDGRGPFGPPGVPAGQFVGSPRAPISNRPGFGFTDARQALPTEEIFNRFDGNKDGRLTESEVVGPVWRRYFQADTNNDGAITKSELESFRTGNRPQPPSASDRKPDDFRKPGDARKPDEPRKSNEPRTRKQPKPNSSGDPQASDENESDDSVSQFQDTTELRANQSEGAELPIPDATNPSVPSGDASLNGAAEGNQETQ